MIPYTEDSPHFFRKQENTTSHKFQRLSQMANNEQNVLMAKADPTKKSWNTNFKICFLFARYFVFGYLIITKLNVNVRVLHLF